MLPPVAFLKDSTKTPIMIERNGNTKALVFIVESMLLKWGGGKKWGLTQGGLSESTSPKLVVLLN